MYATIIVVRSGIFGSAEKIIESCKMARFHLKLLGEFALSCDNRRLAVASRKGRALMAYLALTPERMHPREKLAGMLWSDCDGDQARNSLRQCLFVLRRSLPEVGDTAIFFSDKEGIGMNAGALEVDVLQLRRIESSDLVPTDRAIQDLCAGELLPNFALGDEVFDEWLSQERRATARLIRAALIRQAEYRLGQGSASVALSFAERLLTLDNLDEEAHRLLMRIHLQAGQRHAAIRQYELCAKILKSELETEPEAATTALYRSIRSERKGHAAIREADDGKRASNLYQVNGECWRPDDLLLPTRPSVAVLPFDDLGHDQPQENFTAGFASDIVNALARYRWFFVSSLSSSFTYPSKGVDPRLVSRELGVRYILEGSLRRRGRGLRMACQLIDGTTDRVAWADRYDFAAADLFLVEDEITHSVAACIAAEIMATEHRQALGRRASGLDPWGCYHLAGWHMSKHSAEGNAQAQKLLVRAIRLDPHFSPSFARLSRVRLTQVLHGLAPNWEFALDRAQRAAEKAVSLDRHDAQGYQAAARVYLRLHEHDRALDMARLAVKLNPSLAQAHYALANALYFSGRPKDAISPIHRAVRLSPRDPAMWAFLALLARSHLGIGDYQEAEKWARRAISLPVNGYGTAHTALIAALAHMGRTEEARRSLEHYRRERPSFSITAFRDYNQHMRDPAQMDHFVEGLRRGGAPP